MKKVFLIGLLSILLSGCSFSFEFETHQSSKNSITSKDVIIAKPGSVENKGLTGQEYLDYYSDIYRCEFFPSTGAPKMLVVPVLFSDSNEDSLMYSSEKIFSDLEKTFNGTEEETGWESVSSYYKKSSYGKLNMTSDIYKEWIRLDKTLEDLMNLDLRFYKDPTWYVVDYVVEKLRSEGIDLSEYDYNSDGFIDGIWLVYGERNYSHYNNASDDLTNLLWAYTFWENYNSPVIGNPKANVYCWGSYDFMYEGINSINNLKIDAHTFIHETGHMLGLDDYYDYDENSKLNPTGCLDMMDYNIGDHNAYSKFLLGWVEPQVFNFESGTYVLESFESSGDCLLVSTSKNNNISPLEEYLLIEYYTPTGLNEFDSTYNYTSKYPLLFTQKGIKIYHVDARLGEFKKNDSGIWVFGDYIRNYSIDDMKSTTNLKDLYYEVFASNTSSRSYKDEYKILNLISATSPDEAYYYDRTYAKNKDLFMDDSEIKNYKFNDGNVLDFNLIISDVGEGEALIFFE